MKMDRVVVESVMDLVTSEPTLVHEDETVVSVAVRMVDDPRTQTVFVVNGEGRLVGMILVRTLLEYIYSEHIPPEYLEFDISPLKGETARARDVMLAPIFVRPDDPVSEAFRKMMEYKVDELPVVDEDMRVVGDINGLELLHAWLRERGEEPYENHADIHTK